MENAAIGYMLPLPVQAGFSVLIMVTAPILTSTGYIQEAQR